MDNKHFKRLLKESITTGASSLFEEEEEAVEVPDSIARDKEQEEKDEKSDSTKVVSDAEKKLSQQLKQASSLISKIKNSQNLSVETFSQIIAYYFMAMYYDDPDDWKASLSSSQIFNTNLGGIFKDHQKRNENIICTFSEALDWVLAYPAYKNPDIWVSSLRTKKDQDLVVKLSNTLNKIEKKGFALSSKNEEYLKKLIAKLGPDFKMSDCPVAPESSDEGSGDEEKDEATEEFQKLDLKVGDVVVVKNRNGKEIVTTVAEIPDELIVKENQWKDKAAKFIIGGDWSIPLDGKRGFNSKGQHWIAIRDKKVAIRKATEQDIQKAVDVDPRVAAKLNLEDTLEDAETEEIPREDVEMYGTPEEPQAFKSFLKGLEKVPVINNYADEIVASLKRDIPTSRQAGMMPSTIDELLTINEEEDEEVKYKLPDSENIQNIIKKIANDKLVAGKWAYTLVKRFLSRNGMDLKQNAEINMRALKVIPKPEDIVPLLKTAKAVERNLEEQRYNMLLKRFNIK